MATEPRNNHDRSADVVQRGGRPHGLRFGPDQASVRGRGQIEDVSGDGKLDLLLRFRTQDSGIQCGDTSVSITGQTVNGIPIRGSDSITTVGCKSGAR